jgi:hypothetical protein
MPMILIFLIQKYLPIWEVHLLVQVRDSCPERVTHNLVNEKYDSASI